jgi:hypothetical protein
MRLKTMMMNREPVLQNPVKLMTLLHLKMPLNFLY